MAHGLRNDALRALSWMALSLALGCDGRHAAPAAASASAKPVGLSSAAAAPAATPVTLLSAPLSAYAATLAVDEEAAYLMTSGAAYRLVPGRSPERWELDLGSSPALTDENIVYWSAGALRQIAKRGGKPASLAEVPSQPRRIVASKGHFAWLDRSADGRASIQTLHGSQPVVVHQASGDIPALALIDDQVFFVEQAEGSEFRIGVVPLSGGSTRYTASRRGRPPSRLAAASEVFYYEGPTPMIHRLSVDLSRDEVLARGVICSPIAAAEKLYCAQPAGLLELGLDGGPARTLARGRSGTITALAASRTWLASLVDAGENQLAVELLPLRASFDRARP